MARARVRKLYLLAQDETAMSEGRDGDRDRARVVNRVRVRVRINSLILEQIFDALFSHRILH